MSAAKLGRQAPAQMQDSSIADQACIQTNKVISTRTASEAEQQENNTWKYRGKRTAPL